MNMKRNLLPDCRSIYDGSLMPNERCKIPEIDLLDLLESGTHLKCSVYGCTS